MQIFVAVLGASSFTYAEAVWSQKLPDWIAAHVRAFAYFGGVPRQTVSDNLKAGITKACFHEPMVNRTYADMARHYGTAIVPARPYKPRDKAKVAWCVKGRLFLGICQIPDRAGRGAPNRPSKCYCRGRAVGPVLLPRLAPHVKD